MHIGLIFLTIPDRYTGNIRTAGIVFLKRYFVHRKDVFSPNQIRKYKMAAILPYRPLNALVVKYAYGKAEEKSIVEYCVSAIGMAYDTQGTNKVAYDFCRHMYESLSRTIDGNVIAILEAHIRKKCESGQDAYITRLMRTANVTIDEMVQGFPTWRSLKQRHVMNPNIVRTGQIKPEIPLYQY